MTELLWMLLGGAMALGLIGPVLYGLGYDRGDSDAYWAQIHRLLDAGFLTAAGAGGGAESGEDGPQ